VIGEEKLDKSLDKSENWCCFEIEEELAKLWGFFSG
jgi:hypothetical protein